MEVIIHGHEAFRRQWEQATYVMKVQHNRRVDNNCSLNSCLVEQTLSALMNELRHA